MSADATTIWEIEQSRLIEMLGRAANGEPVDDILLDEFAHARHVNEDEADDD